MILFAACGSVVLLHATSVFDYIVVIEIAFMDNQGEITETTSRLDSEKVSYFLVLFFCLLLHGLAVRISLPFHIFLQV